MEKFREQEFVGPCKKKSKNIASRTAYGWQEYEKQVSLLSHTIRSVKLVVQKRKRKKAKYTAAIWELNPCHSYTRETSHLFLRMKVVSCLVSLKVENKRAKKIQPNLPPSSEEVLRT
jgi:hypothetical protein